MLRCRFGRPKARAIAGFRRIRSTKKPLAQPAEQVVNDRFRIRQLLIARPAARLKTYVTELIDEERQRHTVLQPEVRRLIRRMAAENLTWGEERIADELWLKLQIRLSSRTVGKYIGQPPRPHGSKDQRWSTFLRNHARGIVACDFVVSVTVRFRILYIRCSRDRIQTFASL